MKRAREEERGVARLLCELRGYDPDALEPGDALGIDGRNAKDEPCHFMWRQWLNDARKVLRYIERARTAKRRTGK